MYPSLCQARKGDTPSVYDNLKLGERVSPALVSRVAKSLDAAVEAFHRRPLKDIYRVLLFDGFSEEKWRRATRTTNAIERRFGEVRRRTRPMGVFSDRTSMERIRLRFFTRENVSQGVWSPLLLTQKN
jgi:transposase-like protein